MIENRSIPGLYWARRCPDNVDVFYVMNRYNWTAYCAAFGALYSSDMRSLIENFNDADAMGIVFG
ncbi:MAG: hypothetical protein P4L79_10245 [Legionella sp.]|uniref:hypothetical protein n=1 Tax=Legionella sp. TaxID=459 RepID=UPI00284012D4|nr:hypothetical protein [Legionella sp.]